MRKAFGLIVVTIALVIITIILPAAQASVLSHSSPALEQPSLLSQPANTTPTGTYFDHLVFIIMENSGIDPICGSNLPPPCNGPNNPYMSGLANNNGIATQYVDLAGSSQPNYIGIMAATLNGCTSGCGANSLSEINLVDRFEAAGLTWKAYMENQTPVHGCDNSDHGFYEFIHNPFVSFHDIDTNATRCSKIGLANPANNSTCTGTDCALVNDLNSGSVPNFMWLTPNDCDNMHGNSACSDMCTTSYTTACYKAGDNYLSGLVPNILNSNTFKNTRAALFITFDEGSGFCPPPNGSGEDCMYTVWAGPATKSNSYGNTLYNHYSFTKTIEANWNLATMTNNDASAIAMTEFFSTPSADFSISATSPAPVNAGQSTASTITVSALNGFTGTVSLTDTIPSGLSCGSIIPNSLAGSGTASVSCSGTNAGNYTLTITGTSGSLVHTVPALYQFRDFTIAASSVTVNAGASGTSTITVTAINMFAGKVTLTDTVPSGLVCGSITPGSVIGSGTATVSCSASLSGNYSLTATATGGSLVHTATPVFHVQDFGIAASSPAPVNAASSTTSTVTISSFNHFAGVVSLTDTVPSGLTCGTVIPSSITGSGTATVSCSATIAGNYTLTLTGSSGSLVHTALALFQYRDFTISASSSGPANAGSSAIATITVNSVNHFGGTVSLTDTVPSALACGTITPSSITGSGTSTLSCNASAAGNYTLTMTGTSGSLVHNTTAIFRFQNFTVSVSLPSTVNAGSYATSTITIGAVNGFSGTVTLSDAAPSGLTCGTVTPNSVTGSGTATVSCNATVSGNYTLTVTGTNGALSHSATIIISVQDYTITANLANAVISAGTTGSAIITITPLNHFSGTVSLSPTSTTGLTRAINPTSILGGSGTATLTFSSNTAGNYTVTINSSNGTLTHSITLTVQVVDFAIAANPSTVTILAGATGNSTVTITALNRFGGTASLMLTPSTGLTATIVPSSIAGSGPATMSASASTSGDYSVTIRATSGSLSHTIGIVIHVLDYSLTGNPTSLIAPIGSNTSSSLTIQSLNGYDGNMSLTFTVQPDTPTQSAGGSGGGGHTLILAPPAVTLPSVSISPQSFLLSPSGAQQSTVSISLPPNLPVGDYLITVTASDGTLSHQILLTLAATDFSLTATPNSASLPSGSNSTIVLNLESLNLFQGNVTLTLASQAGGPTGTLSTSTVQLAFNSNVNLNLTINVPSNTAPGNYTITIQATSGTVSHTLVIPVRVTTSGLASILTGILNPSNSMSIGALAIFSLFTIFATPRFRAFCNRKPSTYKRSKIEKRISRRTPSTRFIPCSSSPPLLWRPTSRDEI